MTIFALLAIPYLLTIQPDVNGSGHPYMIDVGEIQVSLNLWGTIHYTGYPLYTVLGASLTAIFRALGAAPALGASLVSTLFSLAALAVLYALLTARGVCPGVAGALTLLLGLTESYWIHSAVAEVYSLYTLFVALALWWVMKDARAWRLRDWLVAALVLGLGVGHHRAVAFVIPGLAVWLLPQVWQQRRHMPSILLLGTLVFLSTFAVYAYLPARGCAGAQWVYGQPCSWEGFWAQFTGVEAGGFAIDPPHDLPDLAAHVAYIVGVLAHQLTWPGLLAGTASLVALLLRPGPSRRFAAAIGTSILSYLAFAVWLPEAVLAPALLMPVSMLLVLAAGASIRAPNAVTAAILAGACLVLALTNGPFIYGLTHDPTGRAAIDRLAALPAFDREPVLMLAWGGNYFAANYGRYVTGELANLAPVDHRANLAEIVARGDPLVTLPETFYLYPLSQWDAWLGRAHLTSAAPGIVQITDRPGYWPATGPAAARLRNGVTLLRHSLTRREDGAYHLVLFWRTDRALDADYSVFVHLTRAGAPAEILAQYDVAAPVYGWYPTTRWSPGEVVREDYTFTLPRDDSGPLDLRVGMYRQTEDGGFENFEAPAIPVPASSAATNAARFSNT
ncbi:MAG: DUF2723 domain-containing protein [Anaerolineae bacterium]|nr:DUF2723 domain-containing protein [Anaerolineae bacterium]